jgi:RNA polymerase sigma-70 factor, ECF subfamily
LKDADIVIFELIQKGDHKAFEQLFKKYFAMLSRYSISIGYDPELAKEVVQNLFTILWEKRRAIQINSSVKAYLFTAVHNATINHKKRNTFLRHIDEFENLSDQGMKPEESEGLEAKIRQMQSMIESLPPRCAEVFVLAKLKGVKQSEVAGLLGISIKTVEAQIAKAKKILAEGLKKSSSSE